MAISRGNVRHRISENVWDFLKSLTSTGKLKGASELEQAPLKVAVQQMFSGGNVTLFPFARTSLHAILKCMNLPQKSKILMTPITIGPMVEVIESLGHEVVFVDIETQTYGPNLDDLILKLREGAACFLLTHLFGYVSRVDEAVKLCREAGVWVIEDISHNLGSRLNGIPLGQWGDVAIYSASLLKYVDGYNGAFTVTKNQDLADELDKYSRLLLSPDEGRIRGVILKTLIWNLALNRWVFNLATWPMLRLLKFLSSETFERILGPGIPFVRSKELPSYYFEEITVLQCNAMLHNLNQLPKRLLDRRKMASQLNSVINSCCNSINNSMPLTLDSTTFNTYWQYVLPVRSTSEAREALFAIGVESNTTNLRDLAFEYGIELPGARALKEYCIFIPLHGHLNESDYQLIIKCLIDTCNFDCKTL